MISKTIGYNGVHDIFRHTHILNLASQSDVFLLCPCSHQSGSSAAWGLKWIIRSHQLPEDQLWILQDCHEIKPVMTHDGSPVLADMGCPIGWRIQYIQGGKLMLFAGLKHEMSILVAKPDLGNRSLSNMWFWHFCIASVGTASREAAACRGQTWL